MPVITAITWVADNEMGSMCPDRGLLRHPLPADLSGSSECFASPVKNFGRFTEETRRLFGACSLALGVAEGGTDLTDHTSTGIVGTGSQGVLAADRAYFADYVAGGRQMGRGNLFLYTLPSSPLAEVSIHFKLGGPLMHVDGPRNTLARLLRTAVTCLTCHQATRMLATWSTPEAAVCLRLEKDMTSAALPLDWQQLADDNQAQTVNQLVTSVPDWCLKRGCDA